MNVHKKRVSEVNAERLPSAIKRYGDAQSEVMQLKERLRAAERHANDEKQLLITRAIKAGRMDLFNINHRAVQRAYQEIINNEPA